MTPDELHRRFEAIFRGPPYEFTVDRFPELHAWPGNYKDYKVQCAWDGFQEGAANLLEITRERDALREALALATRAVELTTAYAIAKKENP